MKKTVLSLAVAAGVAGVMSAAQAQMHVNDKGLGEVLVYPFYTAEGGNDTLVHIANTTMQAKAVKIRFLEAENSLEVRDFNLYLSPRDHFSFTVTATADGAKLVTTDESCTVPEIPIPGDDDPGSWDPLEDGERREIAFTSLLYDGTLSAASIPEINADPERVRTGYIEVIEMGQIDPDGTDIDADADPGEGAVFTAIKHGSDGVPDDCSLPIAAWTAGGPWANEAAGAPTVGVSDMLDNWLGGGLYGFATVINVTNGTSFGYDAVPVDDFVVDGVGTGSELHYAPGDVDPSFSSDGQSGNAIETAATIFKNGSIETYDFDGARPALDAARVKPSEDAVSALFMTTEIYNDYIVDPGLFSSTDWVITMPTKRRYVDVTLTELDSGLIVADDEEVLEPFDDGWDLNSACEPFTIQTLNREEGVIVQDPDGPQFSPRPIVVNPLANLCTELSVISFRADADGDVDSVLFEGADQNDSVERLVTGLAAGFTEGWAQLSFNPGSLPAGAVGTRQLVDNAGGYLLGLPVAGFSAIKYNNGTMGSNTVRNYAFATDHKRSVVTSVGSP